MAKLAYWFGRRMNNGDQVFIAPTYHPAPQKLMEQLSSEYSIVYYNFEANERTLPNSIPFEYEDLKLPKITFKAIDFSITNTLSTFYWVLRHRPRKIVTEDYIFALPYILASKLIGAKVIFYNANTSPLASRRKEKITNWLKAMLLRAFDEYWHGFHGAEQFVFKLIGAQSTLVPWIKVPKSKIFDQGYQECRGIYVGEFSDRKRIDYTIALYEEIKKNESQNIELKLIGCDDDSAIYREEFKKLSQDLVFLEMEQRDFLVLFSKREPLGSVVIEALAKGLYIMVAQEVGSESFIRMLPSDPQLPPGVLYKNDIGCIVNAETMTPSEALTVLISEQARIKNNKEKRSSLVKDYLC